MLSNHVIKRFSQGDEIAFKQVYYFYYNSVFQLAKIILRQQQKAEDVVADVFIGVWKKRDLFDTSAELKGYIHVSTRNRCYNVKRNERRRARKIQNVERALYGEVLVVDPEKRFKKLEQEAVLNLIYNIAENLRNSHKVTFFMFYSDGESAIAVAEHLNVRRQTVYYRLQEAIDFIKEKIRLLPYKIVFEN